MRRFPPLRRVRDLFSRCLRSFFLRASLVLPVGERVVDHVRDSVPRHERHEHPDAEQSRVDGPWRVVRGWVSSTFPLWSCPAGFRPLLLQTIFCRFRVRPSSSRSCRHRMSQKNCGSSGLVSRWARTSFMNFHEIEGFLHRVASPGGGRAGGADRAAPPERLPALGQAAGPALATQGLAHLENRIVGGGGPGVLRAAAPRPWPGGRRPERHRVRRRLVADGAVHYALPGREVPPLTTSGRA